MAEIKLLWRELATAAANGVFRQIECLRDGSTHNNNLDASEKDWSQHIEAAAAEMAVSNYLSAYWSGAREARAPDVTTPRAGLEVKHSARDDGSLIIQGDTDDALIMWLVTGKLGNYVIRGWIRAADGKLDEYWRDPTGKNRPAYFVPQSALKPPTKPQEPKP